MSNHMIIVEDNGGGMTAYEVGEDRRCVWAHCNYELCGDYPEGLRSDIQAYCRHGHTTDWEGNDVEAVDAYNERYADGDHCIEDDESRILVEVRNGAITLYPYDELGHYWRAGGSGTELLELMGFTKPSE